MLPIAMTGTAVVLGGGISGLSAAYYLSRLTPVNASPFKRIILCESSSHLGGWIKSLRHDDGAVYELGPNSIRVDGKAKSENTLQLVENVGLGDQVIPVSRSHPAAGKRYVQVHGKLYPLSIMGIIGLCRSALNLNVIKLVQHELNAPPCPADVDESVHEFASRRLTAELADYLFDPLCLGVYAGDAKRLSVRSALPQLHEVEETYGSIIYAMRQMIFSKLKLEEKTPEDAAYSALCEVVGDEVGRDILQAINSRPPAAHPHNLVYTSKSESWAMWSLQGGLQTLPDTLARLLQDSPSSEVRTGQRVTGLTFLPHNAGVDVASDNGQVIRADHVFSALPAWELARTLPPAHGELAATLNKIDKVTIVLVHLEYDGILAQVPKGFGYLIPSEEQSNLLGVIFTSHIFPQLCDRSRPTTRLLCMMGGYRFDELFGSGRQQQLSEQSLLEVALEGVDLPVRPIRHHVTVLPDCIPQYHVGHQDVINTLGRHTHNMPLSLLGASYHGVSISDCIYNAKLNVMNTIRHVLRRAQ